jgi:hypothetical protein
MKRVLAIDPVKRGFGFAVLDGPHSLVEWGLRGTTRRHRSHEEWCLEQVARLIAFYGPDRIVVEDCSDSRSKRGRRSQILIERIVIRAGKDGVPARRISAAALGRPGATCTKYKVALAIAGRFPELSIRLPPVRKPWMSEDARMAIFDAVALALSYYVRGSGLRKGSSRAVTVSALKGGETLPSTMSRR